MKTTTIEINVTTAKMRVEVDTGDTELIIAVRPLSGDAKRRNVVDMVQRILERGQTLEQACLSQLAFHEVLNALRRFELGERV